MFELEKICTRHIMNYSDNIAYTDKLQDIVEDETISAVFVCTPVDTHYDICSQLLQAGKHVFCEKPTVRSSEEYEKLIKLACSKNVILYTDYIYVASQSVNVMKDLIADIGTVCEITGEISQFGNFYPKDSVYEVIGVHLFSVIAYIFPELEIDRLCVSNSKSLQSHVGSVSMVINGDIHATLICSLLSPKKTRIIEICGTRGSIMFDMMNEKNTLLFQMYEYKNDRLFQKSNEKKWKYDENNNLERVIKLFETAIKSKDNSGNILVSRRVNNMLDKVRQCDIMV